MSAKIIYLPTNSPRRGEGKQPGASAPGRVGKKTKRPEGARLGVPPPLQGGFFFTLPNLGLKPQAVFLRPFGARARLKETPSYARKLDVFTRAYLILALMGRCPGLTCSAPLGLFTTELLMWHPYRNGDVYKAQG